MISRDKNDLIRELQQQILSMQKGQVGLDRQPVTGLAGLEQAFPQKVFPLGAVHEFISYNQEDRAATSGFIGAVVSRVNAKQGLCLWVGLHCSVFPTALQLFDVNPHLVIFIELDNSKHALWILEEALKCPGLNAVVAEIGDLTFTESRRLQLAVEKSGVTGLVHRFQPRFESTVACASSWRIRPIPCFRKSDSPGIGDPRWEVALLKVKNGKPGKWQMEWRQDGLQQIVVTPAAPVLLERKTG